MKIVVIIAGVTLIALAAFVGYGTLTASQARRAVIGVLEGRQQAHRANEVAQDRLLGPPIKKLRVNRYLSSITRINTEYCPVDFRIAWINYVQSFERERDRIFMKQQDLLERNTKLTIRGELGRQIGGEYSSEHPNNLLAAKHLARIDHEEKLLALEKIASRYGVDPLLYEDN